jgi:Fe-S oxidoreductase
VAKSFYGGFMTNKSELINFISPMLEIAQAVMEAKGDELKLCYQCGTCTAFCPWGNLKNFNPRKLIEMVRLGFEGFEEGMWTCVNCKLCQDKCPIQINIPQLFQSVRSILLEWNSGPAELNIPIASLKDNDNPWQQPKDSRDEWAKTIKVPPFKDDTEYLLYTCCTNDYDPRNQKDALAAIEILKRAKVDFGYIGNSQACCGDMVYTVGNNDIYASLETKNKAMFQQLGVKKIITFSPHCMNAFNNRYTYEADENKPECQHLVEIYDNLIRENKLEFKLPIKQKVTYHDPCYLGRYCNIYDAPRNVINAIPEIQFIEMQYIREKSHCCGGGGGGAWLETEKGERLGDLRILEAIEVGAEVIVTACPYCVQMLETSILGLEKENQIQVLSISELLLKSLKNEEK